MSNKNLVGAMRIDERAKPVPVFAPRTVRDITLNTDVTFTVTDIAFRVSEDVDYTIDGGSTATLIAGSVTGVLSTLTYSFASTISIEVM